MSTISAEYVAWTDPATGLTVDYSLPVFYELEFLAGEGFRRIPHGGIENGALLTGARTPTGVRIDLFHTIECEHVFGPSFHLSETDVAKLREQIATFARAADAESGLVLGWCIAHTRSELVLNEREQQLFNDLFPHPRDLTILAKPDRFKPTRFAFFFRDDSGNLNPAEPQSVLTLPAPARSPRTSRERPAIPETPAPPARTEREYSARLPLDTPPVPQRTPEMVIPAPVERRRMEMEPEPPSPATDETTARSTPIATPPPAPTPPVWTRAEIAPAPVARREEFLEPEEPRRSLLPGLMIAAGLVLFAFAVYGFWLRIAPASIPLNISVKDNTVSVNWPAEATRDAEMAQLKINNATPIMLSAEERKSGSYALKESGGDIEVELTVPHWNGASRGVVRFLSSPVSLSTPAQQTHAQRGGPNHRLRAPQNGLGRRGPSGTR